MGDVGKLILYLSGEAERLLNEVETALKLLPRDHSAKKGAEAKLMDLYTGLHQSVQTLQREKKVPDKVVAELQVDLKMVAGLLKKVKDIDVHKDNLDRTKNTLLNTLETVRETLRLVESGLVELENKN